MYTANQLASKVLGIQRQQATPWLRAYERMVAVLPTGSAGNLEIDHDAAELIREAFELAKLKGSTPEEAIKTVYSMRRTGVSLTEFVSMIKSGALKANADSMLDLIHSIDKLRAEFAMVKHVDLEALIVSKNRAEKDRNYLLFGFVAFVCGLIFGLLSKTFA